MYLDTYAQEFLDPTGIESRVDFPDELPPRPVEAHVRHALFLAFKEALANVVHHANADLVRIRLALQSRGFQLSIEDDGGWSAFQTAGTAGDLENELLGITERILAVGGELAPDASSKDALRIEIRVPTGPSGD